MQIKQLDVVEQHGILLFRAGDKGKESNIYVFRLKEFENNTANRSAEVVLNDREDDQEYEDNGDEDDADDDADESEENDYDNFTRATAKFKPVIRRTHARVRPLAVRGRAHIKERRLPRARGCHLYAITMPGGSHLRMVNSSFCIIILTLFASSMIQSINICKVCEVQQRGKMFIDLIMVSLMKIKYIIIDIVF